MTIRPSAKQLTGDHDSHLSGEYIEFLVDAYNHVPV